MGGYLGREASNDIPSTIMIDRDIDLLREESWELSVDHKMCKIELLTQDNFKDLMSVSIDECENKLAFKSALANFACDLCAKATSELNPIYTSKFDQGVDLCLECLRYATKQGGVTPKKGVYGFGYRLSEI